MQPYKDYGVIWWHDGDTDGGIKDAEIKAFTDHWRNGLLFCELGKTTCSAI